MKDCSLNFAKVDMGMVELFEQKLNPIGENETFNGYLESEIDCFNEKLEYEKKKNGVDEQTFKYKAQMNLLKSKIEIIKQPVCTAYEIFKNQYKLEKDSQCTRVGHKDFQYIYSLKCENG